MSKKIVFITLIAAIFFYNTPARAAGINGSQKRSAFIHGKFDMHTWLVRDETSRWNPEEIDLVRLVLQETIHALDDNGLDGIALLDGYRFRRWDGEFAKDKDGKIAVVNHTDREIVLSDTILIPENAFFIYHELGHVVNHSSGGRLSDVFHGRIEQIDGVFIRHDWTTAEGFWFRGQAHVHRSEAIADAFALWVWVDAGHGTPSFHDTPEKVQWESILTVFGEALDLSFQVGGHPETGAGLEG